MGKRSPSATRRRRSLVAILAALLSVLALFPGAQAHEGAASGLFEKAEVALIPYASMPTIAVDGAVASGEYNGYGAWTDAASRFTVDLLHSNDSLYVALVNPTPGWMAVGFSTDPDSGMGFIVIGEVNGTYEAAARFAQSVSDELTFTAVDPAAAATIEAYSVGRQGTQETAELKLAMNSTLWSVEPGEMVPMIIAFNESSASPPGGAAPADIHFLRSYPLRPQDDPGQIQRLFMQPVSPIPGFVGVGVMGVGAAAILAMFIRRKGAK